MSDQIRVVPAVEITITDQTGHPPSDPLQLPLPTIHDLPLLHAGGKTGKRQLAASRTPSSGIGMEWPLHGPRPRRRNSCARYSRSILQPGIRQQLWLGATGSPF